MGSNGLIFLALLPGILIIYYVYKMDKVEKEPWPLIIKLIIFGMISCIPAAFMESFIDGMMPSFPAGSLAGAMSMAFVSAALCEELCKFALLHFGAWKNPNFGYRFDGIVYGVAVAVGFAILENVLYVLQGGLSVALMRGVMAVPLHCFCGLFMGVFFGAAKKAQVDGRSPAKYRLLALFVPMMIHGIYDTLAFLGNSTATIILLAFVLAMYIVSVRCVRQYSRDDWASGFYPDVAPLSGGSGQQGYGYGGQAAGSGQQGYGYGGQAAGSGQQNYGGPGQTSRRKGYAYGPFGNTTASQRPHPGQVQDGKIIMLCPHCGGGLRVPVGAGRIRIHCPHCGREYNEIT